jgi:hypothetical protein
VPMKVGTKPQRSQMRPVPERLAQSGLGIFMPLVSSCRGYRWIRGRISDYRDEVLTPIPAEARVVSAW